MATVDDADCSCHAQDRGGDSAACSSCRAGHAQDRGGDGAEQLLSRSEQGWRRRLPSATSAAVSVRGRLEARRRIERLLDDDRRRVAPPPEVAATPVDGLTTNSVLRECRRRAAGRRNPISDREKNEEKRQQHLAYNLWVWVAGIPHLLLSLSISGDLTVNSTSETTRKKTEGQGANCVHDDERLRVLPAAAAAPAGTGDAGPARCGAVEPTKSSGRISRRRWIDTGRLGSSRRTRRTLPGWIRDAERTGARPTMEDPARRGIQAGRWACGRRRVRCRVEAPSATRWTTASMADGEVDVVTPMCSQLTYEGLLDEMLQINNGSVEVDASIMGTQQDGKKVKVPLNSSDKLYKEIRDLNFEVVVQVLRQKATSIQQDYAEVKSTNTQSVSELKDFVRRLHSLPEIARHVHLAQHLQSFTGKPSFHARLDIEQTILEVQNFEICFEYIEEMIHKQEPIENVLRLLVLLSLTNAGLPKKNFDYLRREMLHSYGFEHMNLLYNLEKAGLFKKQESRSNWVGITRALQLIVDVNDTSNPSDISYIFSGYAPLSIRLVQHAVRSGWRSIEELLKLLPGPHLDLKRGGLTIDSSLEVHPASGAQPSIDRVGHRSLVLVVFIGGVTFAEIAALRFLSAQEGMGYDFLVATTKVVNGNTILRPIIASSKSGML